MTRLALLSLVACAACSGSPTPACRTGADCASGMCSGTGVCLENTAGGSASGGGSATGGGGAGGGNGATGGGTATGGSGGTGTGGGIGPSCLPNNDGTITRAEVPLGAGFHATFKVATNATFNTTPVNDGGVPTWDLNQAFSGDHNVLAETTALSGTWFENDYAGATYYTKLSDSSSLLGVFEVKTDGLYLRGVVTPTDTGLTTNLKYTPPAKLVAFPLTEGATWSTTSTVSGLLNSGFWTQTEKYDATADKRGVAITPFARFDVIRVKTQLTRTIGFVATLTQSQGFVTECFGTIATLTSQSNELSSEFSSQAELRRLSP